MSHKLRRQKAIRRRLVFALLLVVFTLSLEYRYHAFIAAKIAELTSAAVIYFILFGIMEV